MEKKREFYAVAIASFESGMKEHIAAVVECAGPVTGAVVDDWSSYLKGKMVGCTGVLILNWKELNQ